VALLFLIFGFISVVGLGLSIVYVPRSGEAGQPVSVQRARRYSSMQGPTTGDMELEKALEEHHRASLLSNYDDVADQHAAGGGAVLAGSHAAV